MQEVSGTEFIWSKWKAGSYVTLGIINHNEIMPKIHIIRKYAIAYCDSLHNPIRQKPGHKCVMFYKDGLTFWSHLTNKEFKEVFKD